MGMDKGMSARRPKTHFCLLPDSILLSLGFQTVHSRYKIFCHLNQIPERDEKVR